MTIFLIKCLMYFIRKARNIQTLVHLDFSFISVFQPNVNVLKLTFTFNFKLNFSIENSFLNEFMFQIKTTTTFRNISPLKCVVMLLFSIEHHSHNGNRRFEKKYIFWY